MIPKWANIGGNLYALKEAICYVVSKKRTLWKVLGNKLSLGFRKRSGGLYASAQGSKGSTIDVALLELFTALLDQDSTVMTSVNVQYAKRREVRIAQEARIKAAEDKLDTFLRNGDLIDDSVVDELYKKN
jgi:hypothetical protein